MSNCTINCTISPDHHYPILLAGILFQQELEAEWLEWNLGNMLVVSIGLSIWRTHPVTHEVLAHSFHLEVTSRVSHVETRGKKPTDVCRLLTQCNLKLCNMALVPSMTHRIAMVRKNHM